MLGRIAGSYVALICARFIEETKQSYQPACASHRAGVDAVVIGSFLVICEITEFVIDK